MTELLAFIRETGLCLARNGYELRAPTGKIMFGTLRQLREQFEILNSFTEVEVKKAIQTVKREI